MHSPKPLDEDDAERIIDELLEDESEEYPAPSLYLELIRRLTKKFPCICTLDDDDVDNGVWTDGPLEGNAESPVCTLGILTQHLRKVRPFVVNTANKLGLSCYDPQYGILWTPGRRRTLKDLIHLYLAT